MTLESITITTILRRQGFAGQARTTTMSVPNPEPIYLNPTTGLKVYNIERFVHVRVRRRGTGTKGAMLRGKYFQRFFGLKSLFFVFFVGRYGSCYGLFRT